MQRYHQTTPNGRSRRNRKGISKRKTDLVFASDTTTIASGLLAFWQASIDRMQSFGLVRAEPGWLIISLASSDKRSGRKLISPILPKTAATD